MQIEFTKHQLNLIRAFTDIYIMENPNGMFTDMCSRISLICKNTLLRSGYEEVINELQKSVDKQ